MSASDFPQQAPRRAALYARVSTVDQHPESQLHELREYVRVRGWQSTEFVDTGVSGTRERRPALDAMLRDARRRRFDIVVVWRLDRLGRSLRDLVGVIDEFAEVGIEFTSLGEGIDTSTPAGRLQLHVLAALAEFERARIAERVRAGLARVRAQGRRLGRPRKTPLPDGASKGLTVRSAAQQWGVSRSTAARWLASRQVPGAGQTSPQAV